MHSSSLERLQQRVGRVPLAILHAIRQRNRRAPAEDQVRPLSAWKEVAIAVREGGGAIVGNARVVPALAVVRVPVAAAAFAGPVVEQGVEDTINRPVDERIFRRWGVLGEVGEQRRRAPVVTRGVLPVGRADGVDRRARGRAAGCAAGSVSSQASETERRMMRLLHSRQMPTKVLLGRITPARFVSPYVPCRASPAVPLNSATGLEKDGALGLAYVISVGNARPALAGGP